MWDLFQRGSNESMLPLLNTVGGFNITEQQPITYLMEVQFFLFWSFIYSAQNKVYSLKLKISS